MRWAKVRGALVPMGAAVGAWKCPECPAMVQPLALSNTYAQQALAYADSMEIAPPDPGPLVTLFAGCVAHAMVCHDDVDLIAYLEGGQGT